MKIIKKVEIKHFRSVFDQNIEELNHFNIFGGQNDSGKSNVLRALNLFFNNQTSFLEEFDFQSDFSMFSKVKARESKRGRQYISIKIYFDAKEIKGKSGLKTLAETHETDGGLWIERRWWAYSEDGSYEQIIPNYISTADQGIKRSFSVFLQSIKFVYIPAFKSEAVFSYILKLSAQNNGLFLSANAKNELDSNIAKTTQEFSKDFSDVTGIRTSVTLPISLGSFWTSLEVNSQFEGTPKIIKRGNLKDYQIKFTSRGEGIKSLFIPVILGWLSRTATADHWIWGIDEPENALEALRADNLFSKFIEYASHAQIFVSTHSPSFLFPQKDVDSNEDINKLCQIFITNQEIPGNTIFKKLNNGVNGGLERLFGFDYGSFLRIQKGYSISIKEQDQLKLEMEKLRALNKPILFVEGKTDKIILENAWNKLNATTNIPFIIVDKGNAKQVKFVLENADTFSNPAVLGLFDFDREGYQCWSGLIGMPNNPYIFVNRSTSNSCLIAKRKYKKQYALLLPTPINGPVREQVINPADGSHFGDRSNFFIELMFYNVASLTRNFNTIGTPGGGTAIVFTGDKTIFANETANLNQADFTSFISLFDTIKTLI